MVVVACKSDKGAKEASPAPAKAAPVDAAPPPVTYDRVSRAEFNVLAAELALPLFWITDANTNNTLEPTELATLWGNARSGEAWLKDGAFTPALTAAYESIVARKASPPAAATDDEGKRRAAILKELSQGRPTVVMSDFSAGSAEDKAVVQHVLVAADLVEKLHARQMGTAGMEAQIPAEDTASRQAFHRNQGPWCTAPATQDDPLCNALPGKPARISGVYPVDIQADKKFCETLQAHKDAKALMAPFVVVTKDAQGNLAAVPYNVAYKEDMEAISRELKAAADAVTSAEEAAFKAYLAAAAQSFLDNNWLPADEAWAKMNATNSKWYLRVGPDEVYWEPCSQKAGFHVSFARINPGSLAWQQKLDPIKGEMEKELAKLAGKPYKARNVSFHLPDFIDVVLNAGDARSPMGATIGQSLPNWGPVANEGRGRTVAMVNFYTDADSKNTLKTQVESLYCADSMASFTLDEGPQIMSTVLHEAAHNLGPAHEYAVKGKKDGELFGGPLASTLEELKAQSSALYLTDWLAAKTLITADEAARAHNRDVVWAWGHISRGMYDAGKPKPYSQLAAIQVGFLLKEGALEWKAEETAVNGTDKGCFSLKQDKMAAAIKKLETQVLQVKAKGDKKAAEALRTEFVDQDGPWKTLMGTITERWLRSPKASFVYSIKL
ncbi:MAG: hypothetical protein HY904_03165 [Deltaproteobacteria bacterium]|nr:hypothetical protein [Deltaproteobacteria bacterium]